MTAAVVALTIIVLSQQVVILVLASRRRPQRPKRRMMPEPLTAATDMANDAFEAMGDQPVTGRLPMGLDGSA